MEPSSVFYIVLDKVFVIAGSTASGKSALAKKIALENHGVILNGDSLQVYRGLEILTDQPSLSDQKEILHRLYGFLDPRENCTVGIWLQLVLSEIEKALRLKQTPVVVGGTGLYLKALIEGLTFCPPIDPSLRKNLESKKENLYADLQEKDPVLAGRIKPKDHQRILRALEVFYGTGKPLSFWQSQKPTPPPYNFEKILLMPSKDEVEKRIQIRVDEMFQKGVIQEATQVLALSPSSSAMKTIGLRELKGFLEGEYTLEQAKELMVLHTKQYAKRQRTWFRHQFK